jgi:hypothetical protein
VLTVRRHGRQFVSYPKSGRTWIRYILVQLGLEREIEFHHDTFEFTDPQKPPHDFGFAKRLHRYARVERLVYLERDPRDVMVSLYFQITGRLADVYRSETDISAFIRDPYFGAENLARFRELWRKVVARRGFLTVTYEEMHADAVATVSRMLDYYGFTVEPARVEHAVTRSTFERMHAIELSQTFPENWLRPRNDSPKTRSGRIGSHAELAVEDIAYLNDVFRLEGDAPVSLPLAARAPRPA